MNARSILLLLIGLVFAARPIIAEPSPSIVHLQALVNKPSQNSPVSAASSAPGLVEAERQSAATRLDRWNNILRGLQIPFTRERQQLIENSEATSRSYSVDTSQYEEDAVFSFDICSEKDHRMLKLASETLMLDLWQLGEKQGIIRISKKRLGDFLKLLPKHMRKNYQELENDMQRAVFSSYPLRQTTKSKLSADRSLEQFFDDYRDLDSINLWMKLFADSYPSIVQLENLGRTYENRSVNAIRLTSRNNQSKAGKSLLITSGFQGRDWMSVMNNLFSMYSLVKHQSQVFDFMDLVFVPLVNPDGYAYTWEGDRLWRKNRQPTGVSLCSGIDIEHSFRDSPHQFSIMSGVSVTPCSENYGGRGHSEAVEAQYLSELISSLNHLAGYLQISGTSPPKSLCYSNDVAQSFIERLSRRNGLTSLAYNRVQQSVDNSTLIETLSVVESDIVALQVNPASARSDLAILSPKRLMYATNDDMYDILKALLELI